MWDCYLKNGENESINLSLVFFLLKNVINWQIG